MKTRPILFSGEMVRAILRAEHPKTQTRRVVKPQPLGPGLSTYADLYNGGPEWAFWLPDNRMTEPRTWPCPYGVPGDRLWVRETFREYGPNGFGNLEYRADYIDGGAGVSWKPSIHMRREYSRITLEVLSVRVERVQDIGITDADAEGRKRGDPAEFVQAAQDAEAEDWALAREAGFSQQEIEDGESGCMLSVYWFRRLWDTINAKRGYSWAANPWVWVIEFKVVTP